MTHETKEMRKIARLGNIQIKRLRDDVVICSVYLNHYCNRYGIDPEVVCTFFDGYAEYLGELMEEDGEKRDYFDALEDYDNAINLQAYRDCVACGYGA